MLELERSDVLHILDRLTEAGFVSHGSAIILGLVINVDLPAEAGLIHLPPDVACFLVAFHFAFQSSRYALYSTCTL